jgi:ribosomal protein S18 acetylase RimI-like enzyme
LAGRFGRGPGLVAVCPPAHGEPERVVAGVALRDVEPDRGGAGRAAFGFVHPDWRGRGLGGYAVDWALAVGRGPVRVETETLSADAEALFASRGLRQVFAEDVMRMGLSDAAVARHWAPWPGTSVVRAWTPGLSAEFFATYAASFVDRPGFPGWPAEQWIEWISGDDDFAPQWTLLASPAGLASTVDGIDTSSTPGEGFIACADLPDSHEGWIVQVGVVPAARRRGLGTALVTEVLRRMVAAGRHTCWLDVNVNNPGAAQIYQRLGFTVAGRRARYEPDS